jgi:hypothetical protein
LGESDGARGKKEEVRRKREEARSKRGILLERVFPSSVLPLTSSPLKI